MPLVFNRGALLSSADLNMILRNDIGQPTNAYNIYYSIYDMTQGVEVLIGTPQRPPANPSVGYYYGPYQIPLDASVGPYRIRWHFWESASGSEIQAVEDFNVASGGLTPFQYDQAVTALIQRLRVLLRDNNPDRNYRFAPPSSEDEIQNFTKTFGFIWEDYELFEYLDMSLDRVNMYPPETGYSLQNMRGDMRTMIVMGAAGYAFFARAANWVMDEFSYSISAVSLDLDKSSKYQALKENAEAEFDKMVEQFKKSIHIMKGLQQPRYGIGLSVHLGPLNKCITLGTLILDKNRKEISLQEIIDFGLGFEVLSLNKQSGKLESKPVTAIHSNGLKEGFKTVTAQGRSIITNDIHPFSHKMTWTYQKDLEEKMLVDVFNRGLKEDRIAECEPVGLVETFNLSVADNHNFFGNSYLLKNSGIVSPRNYASFGRRGY